MASALAVLTLKGKPLITRNYRQDLQPQAVYDNFVEQVLENEEVVTPVFEAGGLNYAWILHNDLYFVLVSKINCNVAMLIQYLHALIAVFKEYMSTVTEESIRDNFVVVYELFDEMMDFGYPQFTEPKVLKDFITQESHKLSQVLGGDDDEVPKTLPASMTGAPGACPWRPTGITYKKNEAFLDVVDSVNLLVNANGDVLSSEIHGTLKMKVRLSGMPELKLGLNDKVLQRNTVAGAGKGKAVDLEDIRFHQCVRLNQFQRDRTISFIPPDGEFDLMNYRLATRVKPLISVAVETVGQKGTRLEYRVTAKAQFKPTSTASNVVINIPVPPDASKPSFKSSAGSVKYNPDKNVIQWTIKLFPGGKDFACRSSFSVPSIRQTTSTSLRQPVSVKFEIPYFCASGIKVLYLKIEDRSGYQVQPWVRYITEAGKYEIRMQAT